MGSKRNYVFVTEISQEQVSTQLIFAFPYAFLEFFLKDFFEQWRLPVFVLGIPFIVGEFRFLCHAQK